MLVAGASGALGRHIVAELARRGRAVRALVRDAGRARELALATDDARVADLTGDAAALRRACEGARAVISAAGLSTSMERLPGRRTFREVDRDGNLRLLEAARGAGVERFIYVSIFNAERLRGLEYVDAHEDVAAALAGSGLDHAVVRANGFFSGYLDMLRLARRGRVTLLGPGTCRSNPIHEADLAIACVDAAEGAPHDVAVGGLETLTRREEAELAFAALGREARIVTVPSRMARTAARLARPLDPRRAAMLEFLAAVQSIDMLAPPAGECRLGDYLRQHAAPRA